MVERTLEQPVEAPRVERRKHHWSLTLLGIALILVGFYYGELVLAVFFFSILISFALAPVVERLERLRLPRSVAAFITVCLLLTLVYAVTATSYNQAVIFADNFPKYSQKVRSIVQPFRAQAEKFERTTEAVDDTDSTVPATSVVTVRPARTWADVITHGFGPITEGVLAASFLPFVVYFLLTWHHHARSSTVMLFPLRHRNTAFITLGLIAKMLRGFIVGNLLVGLFISLASVAIFWFLGVPFFYFVGVLSGFLSLVPYLGIVLAVAPPFVVGLGQMSAEDMAIVVGAVVVLHLFAINVLYPKFLGRRLKLNPLAVTLALLFWGFIWGAIGLVLAVPLTAAMKIIFDHVDSMKPYAVWLGE
jgi:predicted PurR-regulated permease PerM